MPDEKHKTVEIEDGVSVDVVIKPPSESDVKCPHSCLDKKRNFEKRPTKPKRPPIPKLFQPCGGNFESKKRLIQDLKKGGEDIKGVKYHTQGLYLKRNTMHRKKAIVLSKIAPPTLIPNTHRAKSALWLM